LSVVEPANPQTQFEVNLLEAGADLDEGGRARGLGLLRRFAPVGAVDAAIRKNLRLDAAPASLHRTSVPE
jgi:hypothetical protein